MTVHLGLAKKNLDYMLDWIGRFDNKASIILGLNLGMLSLLVSFAPPLDMWTRMMWGAIILTIIALGLSFLCIYFSIFPRTTDPGDSLFYFGSIAKRDCNEYQQEFISKSDADHVEDILAQVHRNAVILTTKFEYLKGAYLTLILGVVPWTIALFLFRTIPTAAGV